jgi:hypothetical protein
MIWSTGPDPDFGEEFEFFAGVEQVGRHHHSTGHTSVFVRFCK